MVALVQEGPGGDQAGNASADDEDMGRRRG